MKLNSILGVGAIALAAVVASAEEPVNPEAVPQEGPAPSRWTLSAGPAWRSHVKMSIKGTSNADPLKFKSSTRSVTDGEIPNLDQSPEALGVSEHLLDPEAGKTVPADQERWVISYSATRTETSLTVTPGVESWTADVAEDESPMGVNLQAGYDFWVGKYLAFSLGLRFAGFKDMDAEASGSVGGGSVRESIVTTTTKNTNFYFDDPYTGNVADDLWEFSRVSDMDNPTYGESSTEKKESVIARGSVRSVSTHLECDLYQIGIGPSMSWSPFAGWCKTMECLDLYCGAEFLCNFPNVDFDADGVAVSSDDFLSGFGCKGGLVGNVTDWLAIYAQAGYEWIEKTEVSAAGFKAEIDYSSLVLSAGLQIRF